MKKKGLFIVGLTSLLLCSCYFTINPQPKSANGSSKENDSSFISGNSSEPINISSNPTSDSVISSSKVISSSNSSASSSESNFIVKQLTIDTVDEFPYTYSTGNYGSITLDGTSYDYYRTVGTPHASSMPYLIRLIDKHYPYADGGYPSYFGNSLSNAISGMTELQIRYRSESSVSIKYYRISNNVQETILPAKEYYNTVHVALEDYPAFFRISTMGSNVDIAEIIITSEKGNHGYSFSAKQYNENRKSFTPCSSSLVDAVTTYTMNISPSETRTYTYYSKDYCYSNYDSIDKSKAFLTNPVDVCNYYLAFKEFPANYVTSEEKGAYGAKFANYARQVSTYTRTDSYAKLFPYNKAPGKDYPIYHELDIDLDGTYALNSRGVGRIVAWEYGCSKYDDSNPVCLYTDDHYASFQEYNCMGGFAQRYCGEMRINAYYHCPLTKI